MRTIRVTGKGMLKLRPDTTRITITLEDVRKEYAEALRSAAEEAEVLRELLAGFGFGRSDLKTLQLNVDTEYESYEERGAYRQRLMGYRFRHLLKVEFLSDNERLGKVLYALASCPVRPEFRISYTLSDPEAARNALLASAVTDAREKAEVLSGAAGTALGDIQSIDYSWGEIDFEVRPMARMAVMEDAVMKGAGGSFDLDMEPDDVEISDTVTVIWEIGS